MNHDRGAVTAGVELLDEYGNVLLGRSGGKLVEFVVDAALPPQEHRETEDPAVQAEDRYVEITLITVGR